MDGRYVVAPVVIVISGIMIATLAIQRIPLLKRKRYPAWRQATEGAVLSLIVIAGAALACISGWNGFALHRFREQIPGLKYQVNGHAMRIHCTGTGMPTIVLDAGLGNDGLIWGGVQPVLAKTTRVCSYDRAGFGLSDARPMPRDADHIAAELHGLLTEAGIHGPIVLMGHSISGIYIRDYASHYPDEVAGLIFVDGSTPLQGRHPAFKALEAKHAPFYVMWMNEAVFSAGIPRLMRACSMTSEGVDTKAAEFDGTAAKLQGDDICEQRFDAISAELGSMDRSGEETVTDGSYGDLPVLIFSQDPAKEASDRDRADVAKAWNEMQENLKKLSTRSRRVIAKGSGHYVQLERPDLIDREVPRFVEQIRGTLPQPTDDGTTEIR